MHPKLHNITQKVKSVLLNYPMVLAMAAIMAATIVYMIENEHKLADGFWPMRVIICSGLGISLMFAVKMLTQRVGRELLWHGLGVLLLVGYYFILPATEKDFTDVYVFVLFPSIILSHLLVAFVAFTGKQPEINFWQYNKNLFVNFVLTAIFTGVLTGGVELAILAVDQLFSMEFRGQTYGETFVVMAIVGSVFIFLLFNEEGLNYLETDGEYPVVLKFFTQFILIPLLLIYAVILYFYSGKILLRWELPEGWVSYLVLAYSVIGILALLLVHPLKDSSAKSWVRIFSRVFYFSLLPLLALLFVAIFTRVLEYGFTEPRYYVLLLAVWLLGVVLYFIFFKRTTIKFIPISLFALGLFSLVFPYFNTFSVSVRSQKHELEQLLATNKMLANGKIDFGKPVDADLAYSVSDKFEYLSERRETEYLATLLDKETAKKVLGKSKWYIGHLFTKRAGKDVASRVRNFNVANSLQYVAVGDYRYVIRQGAMMQGLKINGDVITLENQAFQKRPVFALTLNNGEKRDLMPELKKLLEKYGEHNGTTETDSLFLETDLGKYHIKVVFDNVSQTMDGEKDANYYFSDALFLVK